ncbi:hypothetical protein RSOL_365820, partial [Rhizoctonia solani AG-3 Rhs1AP]
MRAFTGAAFALAEDIEDIEYTVNAPAQSPKLHKDDTHVESSQDEERIVEVNMEDAHAAPTQEATWGSQPYADSTWHNEGTHAHVQPQHVHTPTPPAHEPQTEYEKLMAAIQGIHAKVDSEFERINKRFETIENSSRGPSHVNRPKASTHNAAASTVSTNTSTNVAQAQVNRSKDDTPKSTSWANVVAKSKNATVQPKPSHQGGPSPNPNTSRNPNFVRFTFVFGTLTRPPQTSAAIIQQKVNSVINQHVGINGRLLSSQWNDKGNLTLNFSPSTSVQGIRNIEEPLQTVLGFGRAPFSNKEGLGLKSRYTT